MKGFVFMLICHVLAITSANNATIILPATGNGVCEGGNITLRCMGFFNNMLSLGTWSRNQQILSGNSTPDHFVIIDSDVSGLIITNVVPANSSNRYTCSVGAGSVTSNEVYLDVAGPPIPDGSIILTEDCLITVASWNVTSDSVCGSVSYEVTITSSNGMRMMNIPDNSYSFRETSTLVVTGRNNAGLGQQFNPTMISVAGPPSNVTFEIVENCTEYFILSWYLDSDNMECGSVSYNVTISPSGLPMIINESTYNFTGLTLNSSYTINVTGRNDAGVGESSIMAMDTLTMEDAVPNAVRNFRDDLPRPNSVTVKWDIPVSNGVCGNEILHYQLVISSDPEIIITVYQLEYTFSDLMSNTTYNITVAAVNRAGVGMTDSLITKTTSSPEGGDGDDFPWWIIIIIVVVLVCVGCCTSSIFIFCCDKPVEGCAIKCCYITLTICSFGLALLVWFVYDSIKKCRSKDKEESSKENGTCYIILAVCSCGLTILIWWIYEKARSCKVKDGGDAPDSQNMPLQDTNKPVRSAAEEQALYSYARTGPINVVVEGGSSTRPGDKPRQT